MNIILKEYLERLEALHNDIEQCLHDLPVEALNWRPSTNMNSLAVLAMHVAGSEEYWISTVAGGDPSDRNRDLEFQAADLDANTLIVRLTKALNHNRAVLAQLTPLDLEEKRLAPQHNESIVVAWSLLHALEHTATHLGHMQLTRDLWEAQQAG